MYGTRKAGWWLALVLLAVVASLTSCNQPAQPAAQKAFATPDDAGKALVDAAKSDNGDAMLAIFGPGSKELIYSGDPAEDKASFAAFVSDYGVMHRWRQLNDSSQVLITGADNRTFPIPLTKNAAGQWAFDTAAGKQEILSRRIGSNELAAIDVCAALVDAQRQYFVQAHDGTKQYAQKFISDDGKQNGLYWPAVEGKPLSPLGPLVAFATDEGMKVKPDAHQPFHGYYFHMLSKQGAGAKGGAKDYLANGKMTGGFAVVAYPAQYGDSGLMTFLVNQDGVIFEKDLGKSTADVAAGMTEFNPDGTWKAVEQ